MKQTFSGKIVDVRNRKIFKGKVAVEQGIIQSVTPCELRNGEDKGYIMPGFIDAHIHIESSMLIPAEFARWAIYQGTVASVSDPHEIANVIGEEGVDFMIENGRTVPFKFFFGAPSCVPATQFETAGAALPSSSIKKLLQREDIKYLAEMMNWPGVLQKEPEVLAKIQVAKDLNKVVDGHAPGLRGRQAIDYFSMGISTDHECTAYREAIEKIKAGAKIAIREGSAAKNFEALHPLFLKYPQALMLCSDDKHPDDLMEGHINKLVIRALKKGYALFDVLYAACIQPIDHYGLEVGALQPGDPADFIRVENLRDFTLNDVFIDGKQVLHSSQLLFDRKTTVYPTRMHSTRIRPEQIQVRAKEAYIRLIVAHDGELMSSSSIERCSINAQQEALSDPHRDILKIVVFNRYWNSAPSVAFIKGFGLKSGAMASSVAHDCHNIIAVGVEDEDISQAINAIIQAKGGISFVNKEERKTLALPVAGMMSAEPGDEVARQYKWLDQMAKEAGSSLSAPFMTLSFMALLVIPSLKISDKGLFDGEEFQFVDLFVKKA